MAPRNGVETSQLAPSDAAAAAAMLDAAQGGYLHRRRVLQTGARSTFHLAYTWIETSAAVAQQAPFQWHERQHSSGCAASSRSWPNLPPIPNALTWAEAADSCLLLFFAVVQITGLLGKMGTVAAARWRRGDFERRAPVRR